MIKDLFVILAIVSVNVIKLVILMSIWTMKIVNVGKKIVDELVEECTENIEETKLVKKNFS